jgi:hypothetical protein
MWMVERQGPAVEDVFLGHIVGQQHVDLRSGRENALKERC